MSATPQLDPSFAQPASTEQLEQAAAGLTRRGYTVHIVDTGADARTLVLDLLPKDRGVFTASSETLRLAGITAAIDDDDAFVSVRRQIAEAGGDFASQVRLGAAPDVVVGSVHAITEDGQMVAASASGSQLASYAAGALTAIWVVGAQKVVPDLDTALRRVRTHSLPLEYDRLYEARGSESFIGKILIFEREAMPNRGTVVLVRERIGF
jgi:hypothetical protein